MTVGPFKLKPVRSAGPRTTPLRVIRGFTLIELMLVVAIIAVIATIALPAYEGYIREAQFTAARANADSLRVFMEDYHLDNSDYRAGGLSSFNEAQLTTNFGWRPDGDNNVFTYNVTAQTNNWHITVEHISGNWIRCEDRMSNCCDSDDGASTLAGCVP